MASKYNAVHGPQIRTGFYKSIHKGEDAWLQRPDTTINVSSVEASVDIFGIFDGHGGKQAATYASRHMADLLLATLAEENMAEFAKECEARDQLLACSHVTEEMSNLWEAQDQLVDVLPGSLTKVFGKLQTDFFQHTKVSGTTATVAAIVGWQLLVANVGDSCAYLDTGSEVLQVSGNHRLDDSKAEQERIKQQGFEVSSSRIEGRPCGPLRVWPGGLAMGRTLGDLEAGDVVLSTPEVRQVTLPVTGGRVIIASDGLWDAVAAKTAAHHIRGIPASKAARELGQAALKTKGLRDDITILVIDLVPNDDHKMPPQLTKDGSGKLQAQMSPVAPINVQHPLEDSNASQNAWQEQQWERRLTAVLAAIPTISQDGDNCAEQDLQQNQDLESLSLQSDSTVMHPNDLDDEISRTAADDSECSEGADLDAKAYLGNNPYALVDEQPDADSAEETLHWETVPSKSKLVPSPGRKHSLPASDGSPSGPWQVPKALKEAPLSPAASPMQTSELSSSASRESYRGRGGGRRGRGRGPGRGRSHIERHQGRSMGEENVPQHMNGFCVPAAHPNRSSYSTGPLQAEVQSFQPGLSFLVGGGFSLQPTSLMTPAQASEQHFAMPATLEFTPATQLPEERPGNRNRPQRDRHNRGPQKPRESGQDGVQPFNSSNGAKPHGRAFRPRRATNEESNITPLEYNSNDSKRNARGRRRYFHRKTEGHSGNFSKQGTPQTHDTPSAAE